MRKMVLEREHDRKICSHTRTEVVYAKLYNIAERFCMSIKVQQR